MNDFLRNYVMSILDKMIDAEKEDDYKIMNYALSWYEKNVLIQADLEAVQALINEKNTVETEIITETEAEILQTEEMQPEQPVIEETPIIE